MSFCLYMSRFILSRVTVGWILKIEDPKRRLNESPGHNISFRLKSVFYYLYKLIIVLLLTSTSYFGMDNDLLCWTVLVGVGVRLATLGFLLFFFCFSVFLISKLGASVSPSWIFNNLKIGMILKITKKISKEIDFFSSLN